MAKLTTSQAIRLLLTSEQYLDLFLSSGYTSAYRRQLRHRLKAGELSAQLQDDLLTRCGFTVVQEKRWNMRP